MPTEQVASPANPLTQLPIIPYLLIGLVFYFLVIKPQRQKQKETKQMLENIKKNDEVVTTSGIHGTVVNVKDKTVVVRVDDSVKIEFDKEAIVSITKSSSASTG
jgi:preprotein translocase subunit YajC